MEIVTDAGKNAAAKFPASAKDGSEDNETLQKTKLAAADVIKALALAADEVNRATVKANEKIQKASD